MAPPSPTGGVVFRIQDIMHQLFPIHCQGHQASLKECGTQLLSAKEDGGRAPNHAPSVLGRAASQPSVHKSYLKPVFK